MLFSKIKCTWKFIQKIIMKITDFAKLSSGIKWNICATVCKLGQSICMAYSKYWAQYGFKLVNLVGATVQANVIFCYKYR